MSVSAEAEALQCGATCRDGSACAKRPEPGKSRCFSHGGAPRSGAPKGNANARKHGKYSRLYKEEIQRQQRIHRLKEDAVALLAGRDLPGRAHRTGPEAWQKSAVRCELMLRLDGFRARFRGVLHGEVCEDIERTILIYAPYDVLRRLYGAPQLCASREEFLNGICNAFLSADDEAYYPGKFPQKFVPELYALAWRDFCGELYEQYCPPPRSKRSATGDHVGDKREFNASMPT